MSDERPDFADALESFGVPATVKRKDEAPIATVGIFVLPSMDQVAAGIVTARHRLVSFGRDAWVTTAPVGLFAAGDTVPGITGLPEGTRLVAAERDGDPVRGWIVDQEDIADADRTRVLVIPDREYRAEEELS